MKLEHQILLSMAWSKKKCINYIKCTSIYNICFCSKPSLCSRAKRLGSAAICFGWQKLTKTQINLLAIYILLCEITNDL